MGTHRAKRVLVIDDDELSRAVLELHLSAAGYGVVQAESGDAAAAMLEQATEPICEAVLSDLQMPGLSGAELARRLRAATGAAMPLLVMSGSEPSPERIEGFDRFLMKPFTVSEMEEALRELDGRAAETGVRVSADGTADKPQHPLVDEATFGQMQTMMRSEQLAELFRLALTELEKHRSRMADALTEGDDQGLRASAHAMKGGFSILGAAELCTLGARLETGDGSPADKAATLREIPHAAERLRRMLSTRGLPI